MITFADALDVVSQLPIEQQEELIDIIKRRNAEARRRQILEECREGLAEYRSGTLAKDQNGATKNTFWQGLQEFRLAIQNEGINFTDEDFADLRDRSEGREIIL